MCGRYTLSHSARELAEHFETEDAFALAPRYNIAPTQPVPVVCVSRESGERRLEERLWGLLPHWAKQPKPDARMINARVETVATKPAFRDAFRHRRCLLPADGFYEWKARQPHWIHRPGGALFAFAGLYERWLGEGGEVVDSCTLLTTEAGDSVRPLHDRMPLVLAPELYADWLDPSRQDPDAVLELLAAPLADWEHHTVGSAVNSPRNDGPECVAEEAPAQADLF